MHLDPYEKPRAIYPEKPLSPSLCTRHLTKEVLMFIMEKKKGTKRETTSRQINVEVII